MQCLLNAHAHHYATSFHAKFQRSFCQAINRFTTREAPTPIPVRHRTDSWFSSVHSLYGCPATPTLRCIWPVTHRRVPYWRRAECRSRRSTWQQEDHVLL